MSKSRRTPEERERRAKMTSFLQELNVSSVADVQELFKELIDNGQATCCQIEDELLQCPTL